MDSRRARTSRVRLRRRLRRLQPDHVRADLELLRGQVGQYVFISSASAYQKPPARLPVIESTPLRNPYWRYSRDKIACEDVLIAAYREEGFPATIVRPSHTYDRTSVPLTGGSTVSRPHAPRGPGRRPRRRHVAVDAHPPRRLRPGLRAAPRGAARRRRQLPHHLGRGADLGRDHAHARGRRRSRAVDRARPVGGDRRGGRRVGRRAARRQGAFDGVRQPQGQVPRARLGGDDPVPGRRGRDRRVVRRRPGATFLDPAFDAACERLVAAHAAPAG